MQTGTSFVYEIFRIGNCIRSKCTSDKYFLFKWSTSLQSMYNHMVGRTTSVISPFYSLLPEYYSLEAKFSRWRSTYLMWFSPRYIIKIWAKSVKGSYHLCLDIKIYIFKFYKEKCCAVEHKPIGLDWIRWVWGWVNPKICIFSCQTNVNFLNHNLCH